MTRIQTHQHVRYQLFDGKRLWGSRGRQVIVSDDFGQSWSHFVTVKSVPLLCNLQIYNRLTRNGIHGVYMLPGNRVAVLVRHRFIIYGQQKQKVDVFAIPRGSRPLRCGVAIYGDLVVFGDYWQNSERVPCRIYSYDTKVRKLEVLAELHPARHIHFVQLDKRTRSKVFVGTGDTDKESGIYLVDLTNHSVDIVGRGSQLWRAVSVLQNDGVLYWGTDSPDSENWVVRFDLDSNRLVRIETPLPGPAYYSARDRLGNMYIGTTVEAPGRHQAAIFRSSDGSKWCKVSEWRKDRLHSKLFGYGVIEFISGQSQLPQLFVNVVGLQAAG